jgi:surface polysaccharide O-acyltransferase-like enzyme
VPDKPTDADAVATAEKHTSDHIALFDWLRAIAIVAVVVLHIAALNWYDGPVDSADWQLLNIADSAVRFCVPVFFMISGALFLDPSKNVTYRTILSKSLPRLLIPFAVWSLFYAVLTTFGPGGDRSLAGLLVEFVTGHYHLWYLIALAGLYLATPVLRLLTDDRRLLWYFVALAGVFAVLLPFAENAPIVGPVLTDLLASMQFHLALGYAIYFVLGYLMHTATISRTVTLVLAISGALALVATAAGTSVLSLRQGTPDGLLYGYLTPNVVLVSVGVFAVAKFFSERREAPLPAPRLVRVAARYSFGIYLIHPLFQVLLQWLGWTSASASPLISVPLLTITIFTLSLLAAMGIRLIPRLGARIS